MNDFNATTNKINPLLKLALDIGPLALFVVALAQIFRAGVEIVDDNRVRLAELARSGLAPVAGRSTTCQRRHGVGYLTANDCPCGKIGSCSHHRQAPE